MHSDLLALGWGEPFSSAMASGHRDLLPARVAAVDRGRLTLLTADGQRSAVPGGRLKHVSEEDPAEAPVTGDWVAFDPADDVVRARLPRRGALVRRGPDGRPQPLAANVDVAFLFTAADGDFSPRRVERLLAVARGGGAEPVVVLAKADLLDDREPSVAALRTVADGAPVLVLSALTGEGVDALRAWLAPGRTAVMLGTSGVGKSTLANMLLGEERQATGGLRSDGRGRHTTTRRELIALPGGGLLVDAPGIRTVGVWAHDTVETGFSDLDQLASGCRFADCRHEHEPGCAVVAAIADGRVDGARLAARRQLDAERRWAVERATAAGRAARNARGRAGSRYLRRHYREH